MPMQSLSKHAGSSLREVLEEWVLLRVHRNLTLPAIDGLQLIISEVV